MLLEGDNVVTPALRCASRRFAGLCVVGYTLDPALVLPDERALASLAAWVPRAVVGA
jgi:hypothetical protein